MSYRSFILASLALGACLPTTPAAGQAARLGVALNPERLGAPTTLSLRLALASAAGDPPPPLGAIDFRFPANLGLVTSELGFAACSPLVLEAEGPSACPPDSRMGGGTATVAFAVGDETFTEDVGLALVAGPSPDGYLHVLIAATGEWPVIATIVMPAVIHAGELQVTVPPVPGPPGGPDVSLTKLNITIGGNLTYYEHAHGRTIAYKPRGIALPRSCPRGGFRFATNLSFLDGTTAAAQATVACPGRQRH